MKNVICAALVLALCLGGAMARAEGAPGNRLGLETLRLISDGNENRFVSPVSLAYALSLAAAGAAGETREALLAALDAEDADAVCAMNDALAAAGLKWANAIFARHDLPVRPEYARALADRFAAEAFPLDAAEDVNAWVADKTGGLIERLLERPLDDQTRLVLVNAIAMDAAWLSPFPPENTCEDDFHAPGGDVKAQFMHQKLRARYAEIDGTQVIRLGYIDRETYMPTGLSMFVALPPEGGVPALLDALAERGLAAVESAGEAQEVLLTLPKLDIDVGGSLAQPLKALGLELAFTDAADFSGISEEGLEISDVLQKVRVQMDEDGTRAAAATAVMMKDNAVMLSPEKPVEMNVNRPFVLLIAEETTGAIAFAGVVADPAA